LEVLLKAVKENPGKRPLFLEFPVAGGGFVEIQSGDEFRVSDERPLLAALGL
jgi:hypothetical protein